MKYKNRKKKTKLTFEKMKYTLSRLTSLKETHHLENLLPVYF